MARWRSGLTHIPLKDTFMGSNPIRVTRQIMNSVNPSSFFCDGENHPRFKKPCKKQIKTRKAYRKIWKKEKEYISIYA